jgi:hypothetical protein
MESSNPLGLIAQYSPFDSLEKSLFEHLAIYIDIQTAKKGYVLFDVGILMLMSIIWFTVRFVLLQKTAVNN